MRIDKILDEIERAYPFDIFPDTTQAERDLIVLLYPGFIDRTGAMMGRHLAKVILQKLTATDDNKQGMSVEMLQDWLNYYDYQKRECDAGHMPLSFSLWKQGGAGWPDYGEDED